MAKIKKSRAKPKRGRSLSKYERKELKSPLKDEEKGEYPYPEIEKAEKEEADEEEED